VSTYVGHHDTYLRVEFDRH